MDQTRENGQKLIIASEKKDSIAIMSATEYGKLENGIKDKDFFYAGEFFRGFI